jgi:hypothetical protein
LWLWWLLGSHAGLLELALFEQIVIDQIGWANLEGSESTIAGDVLVDAFIHWVVSIGLALTVELHGWHRLHWL